MYSCSISSRGVAGPPVMKRITAGSESSSTSRSTSSAVNRRRIIRSVSRKICIVFSSAPVVTADQVGLDGDIVSGNVGLVPRSRWCRRARFALRSPEERKVHSAGVGGRKMSMSIRGLHAAMLALLLLACLAPASLAQTSQPHVNPAPAGESGTSDYPALRRRIDLGEEGKLVFSPQVIDDLLLALSTDGHLYAVDTGS